MAKKGLHLAALTFENITKILGGAVAVKIDKEFRKAILDCEDSPDLKAARTVSLTVSFKPRLQPSPIGGRSEYVGCDVQFGVGGRTPTQAIDVSMAKSDQGLLFNPDIPESVDQMPVFGDADEE